MTRALLFVALLLASVVLTFPHEALLSRLLVPRMHALGIDVAFEDAGAAFPLGLSATGLRIGRGQYGIDIDSVYLGVGGGLRAEACGGRLSGTVNGAHSFDVELQDIDPARCATFGGLTVSGKFDGRIALDDGDRSGTLRLHGSAGTVGGTLPVAGSSASETPIGEWEFEEIAVEAKIDEDRLRVESGHATASGVTWVVTKGAVKQPLSAAPELDVEFRARAEQGNGRAKALVGLLPKATETSEGWRRYRVMGRPDKLRLIGLK